MEETKKLEKAEKSNSIKKVENTEMNDNEKKAENTKIDDNVKKTEKSKKANNTKQVEALKNTFGDKIVQGRKKKGMSQEDFSDIMGVSRQMVSRWELNTAMPRMQKIRKISEILDISIEDLLSGNENKKFNSPVALNTINLKTLLKVIAVVLAILLILYVVYSTYKIVVLNTISSKLEQYKNLDNYYFKWGSIVDTELKETTEVWYKDGKYKISYTTLTNTIPTTSITYFDINEGYRYILDEANKTYTQLNLIGAESYENGIFMYSKFPSIIKAESADFKELALKLNKVIAYYKKGSLFVYINGETIELNKDDYSPKSQLIKMQENKNSQQNLYTFDINLNNTNDNDVSIPANYKKLN